MDLRATTAGVTSTLEFCMSLSSRTNTVIDSWTNTPSLMYALHNEISDLVVVLDNTRAATEAAVLDNGKKSAELLDGLGGHLAEAYRLLKAVEKLVADLLAARDGRQRCRVLAKNGQAASFKDCLRDVRIRLDDCLLLHNVYGYLALS